MKRMVKNRLLSALLTFVLAMGEMSSTGISAFAAGEEVTVSDNDSSGEAEVSENETAPSVSDDVVSGDEADEVSGNEAEEENGEEQEEGVVSEDAIVSTDDETDDEAVSENDLSTEPSEDVVIDDGEVVWFADDEGNTITMDQSGTKLVPLSKSQLEVFYKFEEDKKDPEGVKISLTDAFREALDSETGSLSAGEYTWNAGDPIPDPGIEYVTSTDTYKITDLSALFKGLENVKVLNLSGWDNKIERPYRTMEDMFYGCKSAENINVSLNTPECESLAGMFTDCDSLRMIAPQLTTTSVKNMNCMFSYCDRLKYVHLYNFDTSSLEEMVFMFENCSNIETINLENFGTGRVKEMWGAFEGCRNLKRINLSNFDFSYLVPSTGAHVDGADDLFRGSGNNGLKIYVRDEEAAAYITTVNKKTCFDESYMEAVVYDLNEMDDYVLELVYDYIDLGDGTYRLALDKDFKSAYGNNAEISYPFFCVRAGDMLPNPDSVNSIYHGKISSYHQLFWGMKSQVIDISLFTGENVTDLSQMFQGCSNVRTIKMYALKPEAGADIREMFGGTGCGFFRIIRDHGKPIEGYAEARVYDSATAELFKDPKTWWDGDLLQLNVKRRVNLDRCGMHRPEEKNVYTTVIEEGKPIGNMYFTYPGYKMVGWYEDKEYTKYFDVINTPIYRDITLYAKWEYVLDLTEEDLEKFYDYQVYGYSDSIKLSLTQGFKEALNDPVGSYTVTTSGGSYTWRAGDPLPDPKAYHTYGGTQLPVDNYRALFYDCYAEVLDLSKWDTSNVTVMAQTFEGMRYIKKLDISSFDTSKVTNMSEMFLSLGDQSKYENLDLRHFDVSKVTDFNGMFQYADIYKINIDNWKAPAATDMEEMFWCCRTDEIYMRKMEIPDECSYSKIFYNNSGSDGNSTTLVYLKNSYMRSRFMNRAGEYGDAHIKFIVDDEYGNLSDSDLQKFYVYDSYEVKYYKVSLTSEFKEQLNKADGVMKVEGYSWQAGDPLPNPAPEDSVNYKDKVISYAGMFNGCKAESLDLSRFSTKNIICYAEMFRDCKNIKKLDLSGFRISASDDLTDMFKGTCASNTGTPVMGTIDDDTSAAILNDSAKTGIDTSKLTFKKMYVIRFNAGGGSGTMADMYVDAGGSITLPECSFTPPEGGAFDKWDAGKPGDKFTPKASCTVKALWTHTHNGVKTAAKDPDCTNKGNIEYWKCTVCGAVFSDEACKNEISAESVVLPALGHHWGEWETIEEATTDKDGRERRICHRNSAHVEERIVPAKSYSSDWEICFDDSCVHKNSSGDYEADYTGSQIKPYVKVVYRGETCSLGVDYTLKYGKNKSAGEGTVTVKGKGSIKGEKILRFTIVKKDLFSADVVAGNVSYDSTKSADPVVAYYGKILKKGKDYTVETVSPTLVKIKAVEGSNFKGTKNVNVAGVDKDTLKSHAVKVTLESAEYTYDGEEQIPGGKLKVTDAAGNVLSDNIDYHVSYSDNRHAGKVNMVIVGAGAYVGSIKKSYKIKPASGAAISVTLDKNSYEYSKKGVKPKITVTATTGSFTRLLKEGRDYTCKISKNKKPGSGSFKLTFKGDYKGAKYSGETKFTITKADVDYMSTDIFVQDMVYTKAGTYKPKVNLVVNGELLKKSDYEVIYPEGGKMSAPGSMTVSIKLKSSNYSTMVSDLTATALILPDKTDISKAKVVMLKDGKVVKNVSIYDPAIEPGIKINGKIISGTEFHSNFYSDTADVRPGSKATIIVTAMPTSAYAGMCTGTIKTDKFQLGVE